MTDRIKVALAREMAAIIDSDVRSRLGDDPVTVDSLKEASIESVTTLMPAVDTSQIIVERDPEKPREIKDFGAKGLDRLAFRRSRNKGLRRCPTPAFYQPTRVRCCTGVPPQKTA